MNLIHVGAASINQTPLDWDGNRDRILHAIDDARDHGIRLLCLPELCITGYGCEDAFYAPDTSIRALETLGEIAPKTDGIAVSIGLPVVFNTALFNASAMIVDGSVAGIVCKRNLAGDGVHYEPRWYKPWPEGRTSTVELAGRNVPIGDLLFDLDGIRVGFEICEDAWAADRPGSELTDRGVDVILNPSASHFAFGKQEVRERFVLDGSRAFGVTYVYANLLGNEAGRIIYDGGNLIASGGELVRRGRRFSFDDHVITHATVDVDRQRMQRAQLASFEPDIADRPSRTTHASRDCVPVDFSFPELSPKHHAPARAPNQSDMAEEPWEYGEYLKQEEFTRAVTLGLFDYLRKSKMQGFVVSLSGGADSSATACLVAQMVQLAVDDLGWEKFLSRLGHIDGGFQDTQTIEDAVSYLLTTAYQATDNSSETTRKAAQTVADAIGANHHEFDVESLVQGYRDRVESALGRDLDWETDDIALQNIQARARAPSIWMFANVEDKLLLATSNRSEAAVGYTTMDGDTAGGVSPIAGIDKAFLRRWLNWMQSEGPRDSEPVEALSTVTSQTPTAELRPQSEDQTDEGDLMPYEVLDAIERAAIRDKYGPLDVFNLLFHRFDEYEPLRLANWVERFFRLWSRNQWKRERYAPSFHLDDENLDPKTWCRFPILSGGFERELREFRVFVDNTFDAN